MLTAHTCFMLCFSSPPSRQPAQTSLELSHVGDKTPHLRQPGPIIPRRTTKFVHRHPSDLPSPSNRSKALTRRAIAPYPKAICAFRLAASAVTLVIVGWWREESVRESAFCEPHRQPDSADLSYGIIAALV